MDTSNLGLNQFLQPLGSPIEQSQDVTTSYDFFSDYERDTVTVGQIKNFNFNSGTGGTLTLGGTANGSGNFVIKDASGSTIVVGNNTGITVYNGSISIQNASGSTTIDSNGVVSSQNFSNSGTVNSSSRNKTGTTTDDISNTTLTFVLPRTSNVYLGGIITANFGIMGSTDILAGIVYTNIDGTTDPATLYMQAGPIYTGGAGFGAASITNTMTYGQIKSLSSGTHTVKLQWSLSRMGGGLTTQTFTTTNTSVLYIVLGT